MAKKKRRDEEESVEEYEFKPSDFDEREFIYKDIHGTRVLLVITLLSIAVGVVGAAICAYGPSWAWGIATLLSFSVVFLMKKILLSFGYRPDMLDAKSMYANYFLFLCLALGVCVVFVNPPFFG